MPAIVKPGVGTIMVVGIPQKPLEFNALDIALGRYKVRGSNNGMCYNMRPAIEFSAKHGIKPHLTYFELEQLPEMIEIMVSFSSVFFAICGIWMLTRSSMLERRKGGWALSLNK